MTTFTSSLPEELLTRLSEAAARSFRQAQSDSDILSMAEEGMETYLKQLDDETV